MNKTIDMERTYKTIKWVLKQQIEKATKTLWTWGKATKTKKENFTCIYKNYNDDLPIYTPVQLLKEIEDDKI
tara:strand:- start:256 stop:471 length:216 start_codon:yes stop_codon:yes gene_type:complete